MKTVKTFSLLLFLTLVFLLSCNKKDTAQLRFAMAAARGDTKLVKELLKNSSIDVNALNGEVGPALVSSSYGGHKEVVKLLLDNKADINIRDNRMLTPLMNAVIGQKVEIVKLLLEKGANPDLVVINEKGQNTGISALTFAKMKQNKEIIALLEQTSEVR